MQDPILDFTAPDGTLYVSAPSPVSPTGFKCPHCAMYPRREAAGCPVFGKPGFPGEPHCVDHLLDPPSRSRIWVKAPKDPNPL